MDSVSLFDSSRSRKIPVLFYAAEKSGNESEKPKLAVISHGYGGRSSDYSFIAKTLVMHGYVVASIQHELPSDEPMATTGNLYQTRMPHWKRGEQTIRFVIDYLMNSRPDLNTENLLLIGHSNGGDMSALFARDYTSQVDRLITLDNRRVSLPRTKQPRILSIRSRDQVADASVLPTPAEQKQYRMTIFRLDILHNDMWDGATDEQKKQINALITAFLQN